MASESAPSSVASAALSSDSNKPGSDTRSSRSSVNPTPSASSASGGPVFRAITTSGKSVPGTFPRVMSWLVASPAKTSAGRRARKPKDLTASAAASSSSLPASLASYDPASSSWKTSQRSLTGDSAEFSGPWPRSGMMHDGKSYRLPNAVLGTNGNASSSSRPQPAGWERPFPTPTASDSWAGKLALRKCQGWENGRGWTLGQVARMFPTPTAWDSLGIKAEPGDTVLTRSGNLRRLRKDGRTSNLGLAGQFIGELNPLWVEWLMGFPPGWTDCAVSETPSVQKWLEPSAWRSFAGGGPLDA